MIRFLGFFGKRGSEGEQVYQGGERSLDITKLSLNELFERFKVMDRTSNMRPGLDDTPDMVKRELTSRMAIFSSEDTRREIYDKHGLSGTDRLTLEQWIYQYNKGRRN